MCGAALAALFFIGWGGLMLFSKDTMWDLTEWNNRRKGITNNERTPEWEASMTLGGIAAVALGIFVLAVVIFS
jgi:hypothetical protein